MSPLRKTTYAVLLVLCVLAGLMSLAVAEPRPQVVVLHSAEAGASANGTAVPVLGYEAIAVQNTIAAAWDGTLTYELTTDGATWTAVNCRNALGTTVASTTVAAANYVVCPVTGAQSFRARVSGRTVGTVTATGGLLGMSEAGVVAMVPPSGSSATQIQGTAADGAAAVGNPVQVGGKDGAGNAQTLLTGTDGRLDHNTGQWGGQTVTGGAGAVAAGTPRVTLASDDPAVVALQILDDWDEVDRAKVNLVVGQAGITAGAGAVAANTPRVTHASDDPAVTSLQLLDNVSHAGDAAVTGYAVSGCVYDDTAPGAVTENQAQSCRMSVRREQYMQLRDAAGNERGANVNASNALLVAQTGELPAGTQNIGDVDIASLPNEGQQTMTNSISVAIASDQSALPASQSGTWTVQPGNTQNTTPWLQRLHDGSNALGTFFDLDTGAGTQWQVGINLRKSASGGSVEFGTSTDPVRTDPTGTTTQPVSGTVTIGTFPDNEPFNVAQFGGAAVVTGTGVSGAGIPRVTISNDSSMAANQSVNVSQINGVTPLMGSGVTGTGSPRVSIATDANVVDTELPAAAALSDALTSAPTTPVIGAHLLIADGTNSGRALGVGAGETISVAARLLATGTYGYNVSGNVWQRLWTAAQDGLTAVSVTAVAPALYNGSTVDRQRSGSATSTDPHFGAAAVHRVGGAVTYLASTTHTANQSLAAKTGLGGFGHLVVTWDVTAADRADANETYDLYITCGDGVSSWDIAHFPQIITVGAKRYTARIAGTLLPQNVTTATPGVAANDEATLKTDTAGADQGIRTLAAGRVRHGPCGDRIAAELVVAGTTPSITHSITLTVKP